MELQYPQITETRVKVQLPLNANDKDSVTTLC